MFSQIESKIFCNITDLKFFESSYEIDSNLLINLAWGDRKINSAIKKSLINENIGKQRIEFFEKIGLIKKEFSREEQPKKSKYQKQKKYLRKYRISHKIVFNKPFYRFWFRYIEPNINALKEGKYKSIIKIIKKDFGNFLSYIYEQFCNEMLKEQFLIKTIGSYWDRNVEIDILAYLEKDLIIAGECKWKNSKICKKTLTSLQKKCKIANIKADYFALFSKSGFSNELLNKANEILLFDLEDIKEWSGRKPEYKQPEKKPYVFPF